MRTRVCGSVRGKKSAGGIKVEEKDSSGAKVKREEAEAAGVHLCKKYNHQAGRVVWVGVEAGKREVIVYIHTPEFAAVFSKSHPLSPSLLDARALFNFPKLCMSKERGRREKRGRRNEATKTQSNATHPTTI